MSKQMLSRPMGADSLVQLVRLRDRAVVLWGLVLLVLLLASAWLASNIGAANAMPVPEQVAEQIRWNVRVPRVVLAVFVGAGLAVAGAVLQSLVRNVLADPYIMGIHAGASVGAASLIVGAVAVGAAVGPLVLQVGAFVGALAAMLLVLAIANVGGRLEPMRLLIAGVAVGYALSAVTSLLVFVSDSPEQSRSVMFWLLGSLTLARWDVSLVAVGVMVVVCVGLLWVLGPQADALSNGDASAHALGLRPARVRLLLLVVVCVMVGVVVSMSGAIGFVGLVVPHVVRRWVGVVHRRVIPIAALVGALMVLWADVLARTVFAPLEIPVGIVTALVGTPLLMLLLRK